MLKRRQTPSGAEAQTPPRDWREYQRRLQRESFPRRHGARQRRSARRRWLAIGLVMLLAGLATGLWRAVSPESPAPSSAAAGIAPSVSAPAVVLDRERLRTLIRPADLLNRTSSRFAIHEGGRTLTVETSLDPSLQQGLIDTLDTANARAIGIVALCPASGQILAMVGYDREDPTINPCLESRFPAASVFKIVTAAAAIEQCRLKADSPMTFTGNQYTLYRSQIREQVARHANQIRFQDAFAKSVNPVFGKLGALKLGQAHLTAYAEAFGFNRPIAFEAELPASHFQASDDPYRLAEIASGFNRETTLSPLHGALMAAAAVNAGGIFVPRVVEQVQDPGGKVVYQAAPQLLGRSMDAATAAQIAAMMEASVSSGTCRKPFADQRRHPVLSRLVIGGKSGSIDNRDHTARIDWFVGFAQEREGNQAIAVSAVVAHEKFIGTRAGEYARRVIAQYFGQIFASRQSAGQKG
jgi:cell division protein FtsI/penicillin-binding protein 2